MNTLSNTLLNLILPLLITFWIITKIAERKFVSIIFKKKDAADCDAGFIRTMNALSWIPSAILPALQWTILIAVSLWAIIRLVP